MRVIRAKMRMFLRQKRMKKMKKKNKNSNKLKTQHFVILCLNLPAVNLVKLKKN